MENIFIIVESPVKAKKIKSFYKNENVEVKASFGHICDLDKKTLSIDTDKKFKPNYVISDDKRKVIKELKQKPKNYKYVLAADDDREGDAIAWHCSRILKIDINENNRIKFNEITKKAIDKSLKNIGKIDMDSVNSQQARRIIDRLFGYKLSPLLWKNIITDKRGLSAGRVQSSLLNILNEHQENIKKFKSEINFETNALFKNKNINLDTNFIFQNKNITLEIIKLLFDKLKDNKNFKVKNIKEKKEKKYAPPPFITSTLQQSAQNTYGFSVKQTMNIAQKLFDNGKITYMRTDSVFISKEFKETLKEHIIDKYGDEYYKNYSSKKKVKGAQEAHEAIRPTNIKNVLNDKYNDCDKKLYNLILKRTIVSHMSDSIYDVLLIDLENEKIDKYGYFTGKLKTLYFDGFLKYDNKEIKKENIEIYKNIDNYELDSIISKSIESKPPQYWNESSIVKKLESSGIGRPSTYSSIINTLYSRDYTIVKDIDEIKKEQLYIKMDNENQIIEDKENIIIPKQTKRIIVTDLGIKVLDYLLKHFSHIINAEFTSLIEEDLDRISKKQLDWIDVIKKVYDSFSDIVDKQLSIKSDNNSDNNGITIKYKNKDIILYENGKFGPFIKYENNNYSIGNYLKMNNKSVKDLKTDDYSEIIKYPLKKGKYKNKDILIVIGPYGYYMKYNNKNIKISQNKREWTKEYILSKIK